MNDFGYGSIYQRASDGRWIAAVEKSRRPGEKRQRIVFSATSREGVQRKLDAHRAEHPPRAMSKDSLGRRNNLARVRPISGAHTRKEWEAYVDSQHWLCEYCGVLTYLATKTGPAKGDRRTTKDHRTPIAAGGSDHIDNIAVSCKRCKHEKGLMDEATFRAFREASAS